jgi:uncharacterized protein (TIGR03790 family)
MKKYPSFLIVVAVLIQLNLWGAPAHVEGDADAMEADSTVPASRTASGGLYGGMVSYDDVVLIVNDNSDISKEIGSYFAEKRGIPPERIINITAPNQETINRTQFDDLASQVKTKLRDRGLTDSINYMVTTTGVPLRVSGNNWRMASVDEELMLLDGPYESEIHGNYWIENPYYDSWEPFTKEKYGIRLVTRLTGYTIEEAKNLLNLSDASFGVTGRALLDLDPGKDGSPGYKIGNDWMRRAHTWLTDHGHESLLDENNTFRTEWTNTSAYYSWGSNDGSWGMWLLGNSDFERGTGTVPSSWTLAQFDGTAERSQENVDGGSYSLKMSRSGGANALIAYQMYPVVFPDHRFIFDGRVSLSTVSGSGARAFAQGFDSFGNQVYFKEFYNRTGTRDWESFQGVIENVSSMVSIKLAVELSGPGTAYWDNVALRVIRPHNQWIPGAIAETCVSTGGRSMTYGTWYGQSLVADLVRDGVSGVKGYVYEPFLSAMSHADILFPSYYSGYGLAEAFWMGSELGSWMGTVIGDPKCTPYLAQRADMGFGDVPLSTGVDTKGRPYITLSLFNKGGALVANGLVELYMDGTLLDSRQVPIPQGDHLNITYPFADLDYDIQGPHVFKAVLNSDRTVWQYDVSNDVWEENITVDTMPTMFIEVQDGLTIVRTHTGHFNVTIMDRDMDMPINGPEIVVEDPVNAEVAPVLMSTEDIEGGKVYRYALYFPFDAVLGFYDISTSYADPAGSPTNALVKSAIKAVNALPTMEGSLSTGETMRGTEVLLNLSWFDEDTPGGELEMSTTVAGLPGVRLEAGLPEMTSNWSCTYRIAIPPELASQSYTVNAKLTDRDSAMTAWTGTFGTWNGPPTISILGGVPGTFTRLDVVPLVLNYTDPEGQGPESFTIEVVEQVSPDVSTVIYSQQIEPESGIPFSHGISCKYMPLGRMDLKLSCKDDEGGDFSITVPGAITIVNIPVDLSFHSIQFRSADGEPGGPLIRGDTLTLSMDAEDPDDSGAGITVRGIVMDGMEEAYSFDLEWKGGKLFTGRVLTSRDWSAGTYWIEIKAADDAGDETRLVMDPAFVITTGPPEFDSGSVRVDTWQNMNISLALMPGSGQCYPVKVVSTIHGGQGEIARFNLTGSSSGLVWTYFGPAPFIPNASSLTVTDDTGRTTTFNGSMAIEVSPPIEGPKDDGRSGSNDILLIAMIALLVLVMVMVIAIVLVIVLRPKAMLPAPMMPVPGMAPAPVKSALDGPVQGALPGPAPPMLPPPSELVDGSHYHSPTLRTSPPPPTTRPISAEVITEAPQAMVPAPPEPPIMTSLGEGLNSVEGIVPPAQHVQRSDDTHIPGDP